MSSKLKEKDAKAKALIAETFPGLLEELARAGGQDPEQLNEELAKAKAVLDGTVEPVEPEG